MMPKLILDMTDEELAAASIDDIIAALVWRLEYTDSLIWADLDPVNDHFPGFGNDAKIAIAEALERLAARFRDGSPPNWKQTAN
jgi:hypothetical protein